MLCHGSTAAAWIRPKCAIVRVISNFPTRNRISVSWSVIIRDQSMHTKRVATCRQGAHARRPEASALHFPACQSMSTSRSWKPEDVVNLKKYPLHDLDSAQGREIIDKVQKKRFALPFLSLSLSHTHTHTHTFPHLDTVMHVLKSRTEKTQRFPHACHRKQSV